MSKNVKKRKEYNMNKKRVFALIMCAMLIVSAMSIWAASAEIGVGNEKASCYLELSGAVARAQTIPVYSGNSCQTTVQIYNTRYAEDTSIGTTSVSTRWSGAYEISKAYSTHRCGSGYTTLTQRP